MRSVRTELGPVNTFEGVLARIFGRSMGYKRCRVKQQTKNEIAGFLWAIALAVLTALWAHSLGS